VKFRLGDADRERLGCPEFLDVGLNPLTVREAEALEEATGIDNADAVALMQPQQRRVNDTTLRLSYKPRGIKLLIWLGLHRAGVTVPFEELDFDFGQFAGWHEYEEQGKAEGSQPDEPPTPSTSLTSSRRTRSRKSPTST